MSAITDSPAETKSCPYCGVRTSILPSENWTPFMPAEERKIYESLPHGGEMCVSCMVIRLEKTHALYQVYTSNKSIFLGNIKLVQDRAQLLKTLDSLVDRAREKREKGLSVRDRISEKLPVDRKL